MKPENECITPYASIEEHLQDCLSWLDECLDFCSRQEELLPLSPIANGKLLLARQEATPEDHLPLAILTSRLHLTGFEAFLILLALAPELDLKYEYIYSTLQGNPACLHPTLGLAKNLYSFLEPVSLSELEAVTDGSSRLNQYCFDQTAAFVDGDTGLHRNLILKQITLRFLLGYHSIPGLDTLTTALLPDRPVSNLICYPHQYDIIRQLFNHWDEKQGQTPHNCLILYLAGEEGAGRKYLLSQVFRDNSHQIRSLDMRVFFRMEQDKFYSKLELLALEAALWGRFLHLDHAVPESGDETLRFSQAVEFLAKNCEVLFLSGNEENFPGMVSFPVIHIPFSIPDSTIRGTLWRNLGAAYLFDTGTDLEAFGHQYRLTPGQTARILEEASRTSAGLGITPISPARLTAAVSRNQKLSFQSLATRIDHLYTWDDLQLTPSSRQILHSACSRLKMKYRVEEEWGFGQKSSYGKGLSILFYGPPGTGKTMAAQVIAHETGLELYRVDLSQIFNKYIGETEKNIGRIFEEAKKADIILFFDEADSLFSKRTEVSNSNDRHSNAEISYLLQKMEEYDGVTILSTNLYQNFDPAFLRRLTYTVHFDMPDVKTRLNLWQSMVPTQAPVSPQVDFSRLARQVELSGSSIKSILRGAAYLAAEEDSEIQSIHIMKALKYEFVKTGKIISNEEFGEYSIYL